jgi:hypothetical protein
MFKHSSDEYCIVTDVYKATNSNGVHDNMHLIMYALPRVLLLDLNLIKAVSRLTAYR